VGPAVDAADSNARVALNFLAEVVYWLALILPAAALFFDRPELSLMREACHPGAICLTRAVGTELRVLLRRLAQDLPVGRRGAWLRLFLALRDVHL
jgi:hypothetical protein